MTRGLLGTKKTRSLMGMSCLGGGSGDAKSSKRASICVHLATHIYLYIMHAKTEGACQRRDRRLQTEQWIPQTLLLFNQFEHVLPSSSAGPFRNFVSEELLPRGAVSKTVTVLLQNERTFRGLVHAWW